MENVETLQTLMSASVLLDSPVISVKMIKIIATLIPAKIYLLALIHKRIFTVTVHLSGKGKIVHNRLQVPFNLEVLMVDWDVGVKNFFVEEEADVAEEDVFAILATLDSIAMKISMIAAEILVWMEEPVWI